MISWKKGYTLIELIGVITISSILAAIAIPSIIGFMNHGRAVNDAEIAETIYSVAQDQLSEMYMEGTLDEFTDDLVAAGDTYKVSADQNLGSEGYPVSDAENIDNVYYIEKTQGNPADNPDNKVVQLLEDGLTNPEVLDGAILIEFNVETGKVLSVFYSSEEGTDFEYLNARKSEDNVEGTRPYSDETAKNRRQGYYGTDYTGFVNTSELDAFINVYDGKSKPLVVGTETYENVLYAEAFLLVDDVDNSSDLFTFTIYDETGTQMLYQSEAIDLRNPLIPDTPEEAVMIRDLSGGTKEAIFKTKINGGNDADTSNDVYRVVWILDWKEDTDILANESYNVIYQVPQPQDIKVGISANTAKGKGKECVSSTVANTHFANADADGSSDNPYLVSSERHLYNVRYALDKHFIQTETLDLNKINNNPDESNFEPIGVTDSKSIGVTDSGPFTGSYTAKSPDGGNHAIKNLRYLNEEGTPVSGLFGYVTGDISNIDLVNPYVVSKNTDEQNEGTGALVGVLGIGDDTGTVSNINIISSERPTMVYGDTSKGSNLGGVVGMVNSGSTVQDCIVVSGVFEGHPDTPLISNGTSENPSGGVVGTNNGTVERVIYGAIAPTAIDSDGTAYAYPIVGSSSTDDIYDALYLSGTEVETGADFNLTELPVEDTYSTPTNTEELYLMFDTAPWDGWQVTTGLTDVLDPSSTEYPYPNFGGDQESYWLDTNSNWPRVGAVDNGGPDVDPEPIEPSDELATLVYFEVYSDGATGNYYYDVDDKQNGNVFEVNTLYGEEEFSQGVYVVSEGYYIMFPTDDDYTLEFYSHPDMGADDLLYTTTVEPDIDQKYLINQSDIASLSEAGWNGDNYVAIAAKVSESDGAYTKAKPPAGGEDNVLLGKNSGPVQCNPAFRAQIHVNDSNWKNLVDTNVEIVSGRQLNNIQYLWATENEGDLELDGYDFYQICDIHLDGTTYDRCIVGSPDGVEEQFGSVYEGNGYAIYDMQINATNDYSGLFTSLSSKARIRNLTIVNPVIQASSANPVEHIGIISGAANFDSQNKAEIKNVSVVNANISAAGSNYVGGLIGSGQATFNTINVENSFILGGDYTGGLLGKSEGKSEFDFITVTNCSITGESSVGGVVGEGSVHIDETDVLNANVTGTSSVGGFVGQLTGDDYSKIMKSSVTTSEISCTGSGSVGGFIGEVAQNGHKNTNDRVRIENSEFIGDYDDSTVEVSGNGAATGGLIGTAMPVDVANCSVTGANISGDGNVGGLIGEIVSSAENEEDVNTLIFECNVSDSRVDGSENAVVGGLVGYVADNNQADIKWSNFTGDGQSETPDISGGISTGGLIGSMESTNLYKCNVLNANISGDGSTGGIVGTTASSIVTDCMIDNAKVSGATATGGLVGTMMSTDMTQCFVSNASISGSGDVGGLVGQATESGNTGMITDFSKCMVSESTVQGTGDGAVGGLIGSANDSSASIYDLYFLGDPTYDAAEIQGSGTATGGAVGYANETSISQIVVADAEIQGTDNVGGIVGETNSATLTDAMYVNAHPDCPITSSSSQRVGGIVGADSNSSTIDKAIYYAIAPVEGEKSNPIIGDVTSGTPDVRNAYYLGNSTDYNNLPSDFGETKTTDQMEKLSIGDWGNWGKKNVTATDGVKYSYPVVETHGILDIQTIIFPVANDLNVS